MTACIAQASPNQFGNNGATSKALIRCIVLYCFENNSPNQRQLPTALNPRGVVRHIFDRNALVTFLGAELTILGKLFVKLFFGFLKFCITFFSLKYGLR